MDHRSGLNALFFVAPGTNKTELACYLSARLGLRAYPVGANNEGGGGLSRIGWLSVYQ